LGAGLLLAQGYRRRPADEIPAKAAPESLTVPLAADARAAKVAVESPADAANLANAKTPGSPTPVQRATARASSAKHVAASSTAQALGPSSAPPSTTAPANATFAPAPAPAPSQLMKTSKFPAPYVLE
jgi:hypothetical protein